MHALPQLPECGSMKQTVLMQQMQHTVPMFSSPHLCQKVVHQRRQSIVTPVYMTLHDIQILVT